MKLYDFSRLIHKYSVEFCLHKKQGEYVGGKWEVGNEIVKNMYGAIVPMPDRKLYSSGGTYTASDRELYLFEPLTDNLSDYQISYNDKVFNVEESRDFGDYADAYVYILKYVGVDK